MPAPLMGAEDFSYVLRAGARRDGVPRAPARPGLEPETAPANHSNLVVFDEEPLPAGVALYAAAMALRRRLDAAADGGLRQPERLQLVRWRDDD